VLLRSIDKSALVNAMAWVTVPALVGPVIGPAARRLHHDLPDLALDLPDQHPDRAARHRDGAALHRPDPQRGPRALRSLWIGAGRIGLGGIAFGLSIAGLNLVPWTVVIALVAIGTISMTL